MIEAQSVAHAAKHAGINALLTLSVCAIMAIGAIAWDTHFFTKPLSWFNAQQQVSFDPTVY